MINHVWTIICSRAVIDRESNNVSIQNALEQLTVFASPKPGAILRISIDVMSYWVRGVSDKPKKYSSRLTILSPSQNEIAQIEQEVDLLDGHRARNKIHFNGFLTEEEGCNRFVVELFDDETGSGVEVADVPLWIKFEPPESPKGEDESE